MITIKCVYLLDEITTMSEPKHKELKQQIVFRHVHPLGYNILVVSQPVINMNRKTDKIIKIINTPELNLAYTSIDIQMCFFPS